jgi:GTP-binding protein Era
VLPISPPYFPTDQITNQTERFIASELIREQVFNFTHHEIPYSSAVSIEEMKDPREIAGDPTGPMPEGKKVLIRAIIHVESDSQKGIVIGKGGSLLKKIGSESRKEIEDLLNAPVFLELWVKVKKNWRKKPEFLSQVGYRE